MANLLINHRIKSDKVYCIDHNGNNLGIISLSSAIRIASEASLDVVQVSKTNGYPMCKILDSGKYQYEASKKEKEKRRKQRESAIKVKEIRFKPSTDLNDMKIKAKKVKELLEDGCRVLLCVTMKGRELNYKNLILEKLNNFVGFINEGSEDGVAEFLDPPKLDGKSVVAMLGAVKV
jgi:translation initiation factor IF-3